MTARTVTLSSDAHLSAVRALNIHLLDMVRRLKALNELQSPLGVYVDHLREEIASTKNAIAELSAPGVPVLTAAPAMPPSVTATIIWSLRNTKALKERHLVTVAEGLREGREGLYPRDKEDAVTAIFDIDGALTFLRRTA